MDVNVKIELVRPPTYRSVEAKRITGLNATSYSGALCIK